MIQGTPQNILGILHLTLPASIFLFSGYMLDSNIMEKTGERIVMKFAGYIGHGTVKICLDCFTPD